MFRTCLLVVALLILWPSLLGAQTMRQQQQREASQKQVEIRLREVREKLSALRVDPAALEEDERADLKRLTAELKTKQEMADRKLNELRAAGSLDWERSRAYANAAVDDLIGVYDRMKSLKK